MENVEREGVRGFPVVWGCFGSPEPKGKLFFGLKPKRKKTNSHQNGKDTVPAAPYPFHLTFIITPKNVVK